MKAATIFGPGDVRIVDETSRPPAPLEVVLRVDLVGICATDVHILHGEFPTAVYPIRPGHEVTGTVIELGAEVSTLTLGTRVAIDPAMPCSTCALCRDGRPNLCENRKAFGVSLPGGAAEKLTLPAANCYPVAASTPASAAVLAEPLACVIHALDLVRSPAGMDVLIYGAGTVGLLATYVARHLGAASVTVIDLKPQRAAQAMRAGATASAASAAEVSSGEESMEQWPLVIDATGAPAAIEDGLTRIARGGTYLQIGVAPPERTVALSPYNVFARELTIVGSMTTRNSFPRAITLLDSGYIDSDLITGEPIPLNEYSSAIEKAGSGETPKVVLDPNR